MANFDGTPTDDELRQQRLIGSPTLRQNTPATLPAVVVPPSPSFAQPITPRGPDLSKQSVGMPRFPSSTEQQKDQDQQKLNEESNWQFGSKIGNPFARNLLRGLDIAGSVIAPQFLWGVPGTTPHHVAQLNADRRAVAGDIAEQEKEAQTEELRQRPQMEQAKLEHQDTIEAQKETARQALQEQAQRETQDRLDQQLRQQQDLSEAHQANIDRQIQAAEERQGRQFTEQEKLAYIHEAGLDRRHETGGANDRLAQHGRTLLDKAEDKYRTASQKADALRDMVLMAQHGNKVAAAAQPLEGTLALVTSQGVSRINRVELQGIAGAGDLFDIIQGKVQKLTQGQPIPPDVQQGFIELAKMLKAASYKTYKDAHDSAVKRYMLEGEEPLPAPEGEQANTPQPQQQKGPIQNYHRVNGKIVFKPSGNVPQ